MQKRVLSGWTLGKFDNYEYENEIEYGRLNKIKNYTFRYSKYTRNTMNSRFTIYENDNKIYKRVKSPRKKNRCVKNYKIMYTTRPLHEYGLQG